MAIIIILVSLLILPVFYIKMTNYKKWSKDYMQARKDFHTATTVVIIVVVLALIGTSICGIKPN